MYDADLVQLFCFLANILVNHFVEFKIENLKNNIL